MKKITKEVKSKGEVLGTVEIEVFESLEEAGKFFGPEKAVALINSQHASNKMNEFRASKTRPRSAIAQLARLAKQNPELEAKIEALIKKVGG